MMSARGNDTEYMDVNAAVAWPVRPWAAEGPAAGAEAGPGSGPADGTAGAPARKSRDRGASAVEWVVITAIVVAIVTGVGVLISNAVKDKAKNACTQIVSTDTTTGGNTTC
jgi:hypothetical protein